MSKSITALQRKCQTLQKKVKEMQKKPNITANSIQTDRKMKFYTGLPTVAAFHELFQYLEPRARKLRVWRGAKRQSAKKRNIATHRKLKDELLMVLMRNRLGLLNEDVADRFGISPSVCSNLYNTWVPFLSRELKPLIIWPSKDVVRANLPAPFKAYPNVRCIIDCTEIFIETPKNLDSQAVTWSDYKKHNTLKFLIGITPNGAVSFLSECWGGRASDRHITLESGFLDKVEPHDNIMADRGFNIQEDLLFRQASLTIPPGARGKSQMSRGDVERTKRIANVRIHVERAIQRVKTFRILKNELPISMIPHADELVTICAAICNLMPPLV
ncbi:PREDICTED: uncharacterized protein LOC109471736 [Branchiostoma belcheri]|uniref:Uncharacterized protein LOC109471736 n=1 Tax=Branchiostoma belcheri TaxID=7741 RepID=A0A6P4YBZ2_BRABE|nr:PREDICTED: uncharacterized protein LOC109471736 [Branchiostoma belcheri]